MRLYYNQASLGTEPSVITHYLYDAGGNRVKKLTRVSGGNWESITYIDGLIEYREDNSTQLQSISHIMEGIASVREGDDFGDSTPAIKYNLDDHLGSSNVSVDISGTLVSREEYYPFGETSFGSYSKKRYRFCGKEKDEESGLYYYGARYYSPWTCRFISVDPQAGKYIFQTPYAYADNNPICKMDFNGEGTDGSSGNGQPSTAAQHTIAKGDTFWDLENKLKLAHGTLQKWNPGVDTKNLKIGSSINISDIKAKSKIIFVNGKEGFGSYPAGKAYWNDGSLTQDSDFVSGAKEYFDTKDVYYTDEKFEGILPPISSEERFKMGFQYAEKNLEALTKGIDKQKDYLNFVTHSMGGTYAEGMISYLLGQGYKVKNVVHINAFEAADMKINDPNSNLIRTIDYQNTDDPVINNPLISSPGAIFGADAKIREISGASWRGSHLSPIWKQGKSFWINLDKKILRNSPQDLLPIIRNKG